MSNVGALVLRKGELITDLDQFVNCEWIIIDGYPYHREQVLLWSFARAMRCISRRVAFKGVALINVEYCCELMNEQIIGMLGLRWSGICLIKPTRMNSRSKSLFSMNQQYKNARRRQ